MCFSPEADVVAGTVVAAIGVDALRHVASPRQLPLAVLPALLAAHELDEAFVWWGLQGQVATSIGHAAAVAYLAFAFVLPILGPLAIMSVETGRHRRAGMGVLLAAGTVVSAILLASVFGGSVSAHVDGHHIAYAASIPNGTFLAVLYVLITCGALLLSSDTRIVLFGASNIAAVVMLAWLTIGGLTSLWCAWAAISSAAIAWYLRSVKLGNRPRPQFLRLGQAGTPVP